MILKDNVMFGFTYIVSTSKVKPYADKKYIYSIEIKQLPYCNNEDCVKTIAWLITGIKDKDSYNIAEDRIDSVEHIKDKLWKVKITKPYKG